VLRYASGAARSWLLAAPAIGGVIVVLVALTGGMPGWRRRRRGRVGPAEPLLTFDSGAAAPALPEVLSS
jgi:hypothetical protein